MDKSISTTDIMDPLSIKKKPELSSSTPLKQGNSNIQYDGSLDVGAPSEAEGFERSKCSKFFRFLLTLTIEPAIFFFMFAFMLNISCLSNLMMDKSCYYHFNYTKEVCRNISAYPDEKTNVEIMSNNYSLYMNMMSLVAACTMIFITPWSDKYGRKLPLILACIGTMFTDIGILVSIIYFESSLNYLILARLPSEIVGGFICFLTIVYSHASEVSSESKRTLKYTTIEISFTLAMSLGGLTGGMIYRYYGYFYVYLLGMTLHFICVPWVAFVVEETRGLDDIVPWNEKRKNFFRLDSVSKSWKASSRPRENGQRAVLWMYFISMCVVILTYEAFGGLGFVYAHHIYNWDPAAYNIVNTVFSLTTFVVMSFSIPLFLKVFKLSDPVLGMIGTLSMMGKNFVISFAKYKLWIYYSASVIGFFSGFTTLAIRTALSKITSKEEIGAVFSFLATCEAVFPMLGTALVTKVFNATININPSVAYLMSVGLLFLPLGTFIWVYGRSRKETEQHKSDDPQNEYKSYDDTPSLINN